MTSRPARRIDVAIVGGGVAGAAVALRLARAGRAVVLLERSPRWRWHACGVFSSPAGMRELGALGIDRTTLSTVARPVTAMRVETERGTGFRLTYGAGEHGHGGPVGFDRAALDRALLEAASDAGVTVLRDHHVIAFAPPHSDAWGLLTVRDSHGTTHIGARLVVGADGIRSVVARGARVARAAHLGQRVGLTWHIPDARGHEPHDARMIVLDGAYCGLAPVPGGRINVGIVLARREWLRALARDGASTVGARVLRQVAALGPDPIASPAPLDGIVGAAPLGHRVTRRAGPGWLLVGDAAGFLDPFTGEGLGRALVSARLAADAVTAQPDGAFDGVAYDRAMRARFRAKDLVSLLVQAFLARPLLFEYAARRLARRDMARETMAAVIGDLVPATRALDPRFVGRLLAP